MVRPRSLVCASTLAALLACACAAACGAPSSPPVTPAPPAAPAPAAPPPAPVAPPAADPAPPELRLPAVARPLHERVDLTIDPAQEDFAGQITTELEVSAATSVLWLNASELTLDRATLTTAAGEQLVPRVITAPKDYVGLAFPHALAPGRATLAIAYRGKAHPNDGDGIYRVQERDEWYAFTQFEDTDARQAFPCFDEPSYKIPWQLTLHTKQDQVALSNMPIASETVEPGGMKATAFAETPPLPSYLVAFTVGPFELVDAGTSAGGVHVRIVVPRGRTADAAYAVQATVPLLERLVTYFGTPFPFPKLDFVAVAVFNAGAMENPGLVTFRQSVLLIPSTELTRDRQQRFAIDAAHEMAHMWFGDLVTMAWWDDTWLNESFASWMEDKITAQQEPAWQLDLDLVARYSRVMHQDSLDTARAIRQPIRTADDIANAFDGITYSKGNAVLAMIEHAIGPEKFQAGVRGYLARHARGNGTYADFVGAMSEAAGVDLHPQFDSFVLQSGVPAIAFTLTCGQGVPPALKLAQQRYKPLGSKIDPNRLWTVPVCVRWGAGAGAAAGGAATGVDCTTLSAATGELALSAKACPAWVAPNADGIGYYRSLLRGDLLQRLSTPRKELTVRDRISLVGDVNAAVASGDTDEGVALGLVATLAKDPERHLVEQSVAIVAGIHEMVPDALQPNYQRFIRALFGARAHALGWLPKPGETDDVKDLRRELVPLVAVRTHDAQLIAQAKALAWKWLDDHKAIDATMVDAVLTTAARFSDQKLFDRLHADAVKTKDREERGKLLRALGSFSDPALVGKALAILLTDEFELRDSLALLRTPIGEPATRAQGLAFLDAQFDPIAAKLPAPYRASLAHMYTSVCDETKRADIEAKIGKRIEGFSGGPRTLAQAMESLSLCAAQRTAQARGVATFLQKQ